MNDEVMKIVAIVLIVAAAAFGVTFLLRRRLTKAVFDWRRRKATFEAHKPSQKETEATLERANLGDKTKVDISGNTSANLTETKTGKQVDIKIGGSAPAPKSKN